PEREPAGDALAAARDGFKRFRKRLVHDWLCIGEKLACFLACKVDERLAHVESSAEVVESQRFLVNHRGTFMQKLRGLDFLLGMFDPFLLDGAIALANGFQAIWVLQD